VLPGYSYCMCMVMVCLPDMRHAAYHDINEHVTTSPHYAADLLPAVAHPAGAADQGRGAGAPGAAGALPPRPHRPGAVSRVCLLQSRDLIMRFLHPVCRYKTLQCSIGSGMVYGLDICV
jgi:hypothetical protein